MTEVQENSGPYSFAQQPQAVAVSATRKTRYRDPFQDQLSSRQTANIMWDKRVYRGNTYASQTMSMQDQETEMVMRRQREEKRKRVREQKRMKEEMERQEMLLRAQTPPPVDGRVHIDIQTETYLEEITDRTIESDQTTQTDPFLERPQSPPFIPVKSGVDNSAQVEDDLFDFDFEVNPILEVIVGKTMEQAMMEVLQEEEMENMKRHQEDFTKKRNAELAETQRMEAEEMRREEEKERRKKQEKERMARELHTREKIASTTFARSFLHDLEQRVFTELEEEGFFYDQVERQVQTDFMDWLGSAVEKSLDKKRHLKDNVNRLLLQVMDRISAMKDNAQHNHVSVEQEI